MERINIEDARIRVEFRKNETNEVVKSEWFDVVSYFCSSDFEHEMEDLLKDTGADNIISTIISTKEITYRQINYLISKSESIGIDVTKELGNYDIKLNGKDAEKELKWLKKRK